MITQEKIDRINALARKAKTPEGLTAEETAERAALRQEYVAAVRANLEAQRTPRLTAFWGAGGGCRPAPG